MPEEVDILHMRIERHDDRSSVVGRLGRLVPGLREAQVALRVTSPVAHISASATVERGGALHHYMSNFSTIEAFQGASVFWLLPVIELDRVPTNGNCTREGLSQDKNAHKWATIFETCEPVKLVPFQLKQCF